MFKVCGFLSKKAGLSMEEFIDYYESRHVPLICSLAPVPISYKRKYLSQRLTVEGGEVDFDVMTELGFADRRAFDAWMAALANPGLVLVLWRTKRNSSIGRAPEPMSSSST
jgi:hypothetical protein